QLDHHGTDLRAGDRGKLERGASDVFEERGLLASWFELACANFARAPLESDSFTRHVKLNGEGVLYDDESKTIAVRAEHILRESHDRIDILPKLDLASHGKSQGIIGNHLEAVLG